MTAQLIKLSLGLALVCMTSTSFAQEDEEAKIKNMIFVKLKVDAEKTIEHLVKVKKMDEDQAIAIAKRVKDAIIHFQQGGKVQVDEGNGRTQTTDWSEMKVDVKKKQVHVQIEEAKFTITIKPHGVYEIASKQMTMIALAQKRSKDDDDDDRPEATFPVSFHETSNLPQEVAQEKKDDEKSNIKKAQASITGTWKSNWKKTSAHLDKMDEIDDEMKKSAKRFCEQGIQVEFTADGKMTMSEGGDDDRKIDYAISKVATKDKLTHIDVKVSMFEIEQSFSIIVVDKNTLAISPPEDQNEPPLVFSRLKKKSD